MKKLYSLFLLMLATSAALAQVAIPITNAGTTGTTVNQTAIVNSSNAAVLAGTGNTTVPTYIVVAGGGTAGQAQLAAVGPASCVMDSTIASGAAWYYVINSTTTAGYCHAQSAAPTAGTWVIGYLQSASTTSGSTAQVNVNSYIYGGGSGGITPSTQYQMPAFGSGGLTLAGTSITTDSTGNNLTIPAGALTLSNPGVFGTGSSVFTYNTTMVGGCNPDSDYHSVQFSHNMTSGLTVCNSNTTGTGSNLPVGIFASATDNVAGVDANAGSFYGFTNVNSGRVISINPVAQDFVGLTSGVSLSTAEFDTQPTNPTSAYSNVGGISLYLYNEHANSGTYPGSAILFHVTNTAGGNAFWQNGISFDNGSLGTTSTAINVNSIAAATSGANSNCPPLLKAYEQYWNGSASVNEGWTLNCAIGSGTNPASDSLVLGHAAGTVPSGQTHWLELAGVNGTTGLQLDGSTSGSAQLSASATGGTLNLGSTNATVDTSGNVTVVSCTGCASTFSAAHYAGTATGAVNVLAATLSPAPASLTAMLGVPVAVLANLANTTTTPTIAFGSLAAKTIVKCDSTALAAGDYNTTTPAVLIWNGTNMVLQNPQVGICQSASSGNFTVGNNLLFATAAAPAVTTAISVQGGQDSSTSSVPGTLTLRGGNNSSSAQSAGDAILEGGLATFSSGNGVQGKARLNEAFTTATALSATFEVVNISANDQVQAAPLGATAIVGIAQTVGGTTTAMYVASYGKTTVRFDGTPVLGDYACAPPTSTGTIGLAHDNGTTPCTAGQKLGVITGQVSGTGSGSTATVLLQLGS